jgi:psiF repeat
MRTAILAALLAVSLPAAPSFALTQDAKMETCKFGADSKKLQGAERKKFIDRCMSDRDDPRGAAAGGGQAQPKN